MRSEDEHVQALFGGAPQTPLGSNWLPHAWPLTALLGALLSGCAPEASRTPLSPPVVPRHDVYFYGPAEVIPQPTPTAQERPRPRKPESVTSTSSSDAGSSEELDLDASAAQEQATGTLAGTYQGSDRVILQFETMPEQAQDDDKAKVRVQLQDADQQRYALSVLDTNTGKPLCTVEGQLEERRIDFSPQQPCFTGILGVPMKATLLSGEASFEQDELQLELEVGIELTAPDAVLEGTLLYHFEGSK